MRWLKKEFHENFESTYVYVKTRHTVPPELIKQDRYNRYCVTIEEQAARRDASLKYDFSMPGVKDETTK